jgi:AraC family transcriptional activator of tynA and feaB
MHHDTASELSFAPRFRPFYPGDVQGYSSALDSLVYPGELSVQDSNPRMSLEACRLVGGGLAISFTSTPLAVRHDTALASPGGAGDVLAMIAVEGEGTIDQGGRRLPFRQGDITFRTTRMPSVCTLATPGKLVMLRVPAARFFGIHADLHERFVPSIARADSRMAEAARTHMGHVFPGPVRGTPALAYFSEQSFVSLLAATYCESCESVDDDAAEGKRRERDRWQRLVACIEAHLGDAELSVDAVSKELGISKRLTHRLFEHAVRRVPEDAPPGAREGRTREPQARSPERFGNRLPKRLRRCEPLQPLFQEPLRNTAGRLPQITRLSSPRGHPEISLATRSHAI